MGEQQYPTIESTVGSTPLVRLQRLAEDVSELGFVESAPKQDGRNMVMVLGPTKKKADAKAEQRKRREDATRHDDQPHDAQPDETEAQSPAAEVAEAARPE